MLIIVGSIIVIVAVLTGFTMAGGHIHSLIHPSELVTIGGAATGALVTMCPKQVLKDVFRGLIRTIKGSPYNKRAYEELFKAMYQLLKMARYDGVLALESHMAEPEKSSIFSRYPSLMKNQNALKFICSSLAMIVDNSVTSEQLPELLEADIKALENEHHGPISVLSKTADGLPGFGIVAAVLGIVVTMGAIDGPVEEVGEKVGAALVGTFLGILLSYGFVQPISVQMEFQAAAETAYFRTIATMLEGFANNRSPRVVIEQARRGTASDVRPDREQLETALKALD
ncbi:MAG: flagellar motor stator protein MotA [Planctomycetaceae bacterium]|nr:flagellar motor stator protein MotA [Planctomycetaceae bacterium]